MLYCARTEGVPRSMCIASVGRTPPGLFVTKEEPALSAMPLHGLWPVSLLAPRRPRRSLRPASDQVWPPDHRLHDVCCVFSLWFEREEDW
jgi:hypothetical protein